MLKIKEIIISSLGSGESQESKDKTIIGKRPTIIASEVPDPYRLIRISSYLSNLMTEIEKKHLAAIDGNNKMKDSSELITRVTLDEFSLYTKDTPLGLDEYKYLIGLIALRAKSLPPNIHLKIGTLPVFWPNGVVQNCGLYVQSPAQPGQEPLLHHLYKVHGSHVDTQYSYRNAFGLYIYPLAGDNPNLDRLTEPGMCYSPDILLKDTPVKVQDMNQYKNALRITSASGQQFIQVIDICLDHEHEVARKNLHGLIIRLAANKQYIPIHSSHIISSKTIKASDNALLATVVHADILHGKVGLLSPMAGEMRQRINFAVGGFGSTSYCTSYPPKDIGILSGKDLEHANWENANNGTPFDVNAIYDGTTILHTVINKSNANPQKILDRINTLKQYNLSVDIPNAQNQTVRRLVINNLIEAFRVDDSSNSAKFVLIAKHLSLYTPELLQQLQDLYHRNLLGPYALQALKQAVPLILTAISQPISISNENDRIPNTVTGSNFGFFTPANVTMKPQTEEIEDLIDDKVAPIGLYVDPVFGQD